jgi:phage repressor protein C with HTH and peptisase S24 domain
MLTHAQIWTALDRLATRAGLSPSGLAKKAGLDPTTFNKSKRITPEGRARWPSTESVSKALQATGTPFDIFVQLIDQTGRPGSARTVPMISLAQAGSGAYFDGSGFPSGKAWDEIAFPALADEHAYALEISGDTMAPIFRQGDIVVVSPAAPVRRGDRIVVKTKAGEVTVTELRRRTARTVELRSLTPGHDERTLLVGDVVFVARIVWASQ